MVKMVIELELPDRIFFSFCFLYPENTQKQLEKFIKNYGEWGVKAKILEWPEKKEV